MHNVVYMCIYMSVYMCVCVCVHKPKEFKLKVRKAACILKLYEV